MDTRKLEYFNSVVKHLNFTRAAQEWHIAQTAMSRQIATLEDEVGVLLFLRDNRKVELTPAGKIFYSYSTKIIEMQNEMLSKTIEVTRSQKKVLNIGFGQYEQLFVSRLAAEYKKLDPALEIYITQYQYKDLLKNLKIGELDVIFSLPTSIECVSPLETNIETIYPSILYLVVPKNHPHANRKSMHVGEIEPTETLITLSEDEGPCSLERLHRITQEAGYKLNRTIKANSFAAQFSMVASGLGVAFTPGVCLKQLPNNLKAIRLINFETGNFIAMHQISNKNPAILEFFNLISRLKGDIHSWL